MRSRQLIVDKVGGQWNSLLAFWQVQRQARVHDMQTERSRGSTGTSNLSGSLLWEVPQQQRLCLPPGVARPRMLCLLLAQPATPQLGQACILALMWSYISGHSITSWSDDTSSEALCILHVCYLSDTINTQYCVQTIEPCLIQYHIQHCHQRHVYTKYVQT